MTKCFITGAQIIKTEGHSSHDIFHNKNGVKFFSLSLFTQGPAEVKLCASANIHCNTLHFTQDNFSSKEDTVNTYLLLMAF